VGLGNRLHSPPRRLSGGQHSAVAVARAKANHPALILADEPTGELDSATTRLMLALLRRLVEHEGVTLLVASHDRSSMRWQTRWLN
jgi:putative ABC transport system ATP-binding protein